MYKRLSHQFALIISICWLLAGCQGGPLDSGERSSGTTFSEGLSDNTGFATPEILVMRARSSLSPDREKLMLQAVHAYYKTGRIERGDQLLNQVQPTYQMDINLQGKWVMLRSKMAARQRDWPKLEQLIINDEFGTIAELPLLDPQLQVQLLELRAQLYEGTSRYMEAIQERIYLHPSLDNANRQHNNDQIWSSLQRLPSDITNNRDYLRSSRGILPGWVQLVHSIQQYPTGIAGQQGAISQWLGQWRDHPAQAHLPTSLKLLLEFRPAEVKTIAALLPQSGQYEQISNAIQKGIVASYYTMNTSASAKPEVMLYNTTGGLDINELYDIAVAQGADFIIGPLDKSRVEALAKRESLPIPTLALNYTQNPETDPVPDNLYQFGLRAEDEIRQMAEHAQSQGFKRAVLLTPKNKWGERLANYFGKYWEENGGNAVGSFTYGKGPAIGKTIQSMLDIPESRNRYRRIKTVVGQKVNFRPRRRRDIDVIFAVASPTNGRLIKPQLEFHYATNIPMYSTSHIFDDNKSGRSNKDIDGVVFCETPWVLGGVFDVKSKFLHQWPDYPSNLKQFAALGVDAYKLHQIIQALDISPNLELKGATGTLFIKRNRSITRRLPIYVFEKGVPIPFVPESIESSTETL